MMERTSSRESMRLPLPGFAFPGSSAVASAGPAITRRPVAFAGYSDLEVGSLIRRQSDTYLFNPPASDLLETF